MRLDGHVVTSIAELTPGISDLAVLALAVQQGQLLLTADRDFGDIIMRDLSQAPAAGVVLYRLKHAPLGAKVQRIADVFTLEAAQLPGAFTVIEQHRVRNRPLP